MTFDLIAIAIGAFVLAGCLCAGPLQAVVRGYRRERRIVLRGRQRRLVQEALRRSSKTGQDTFGTRLS